MYNMRRVHVPINFILFYLLYVFHFLFFHQEWNRKKKSSLFFGIRFFFCSSWVLSDKISKGIFVRQKYVMVLRVWVRVTRVFCGKGLLYEMNENVWIDIWETMERWIRKKKKNNFFNLFNKAIQGIFFRSEWTGIFIILRREFFWTSIVNFLRIYFWDLYNKITFHLWI